MPRFTQRKIEPQRFEPRPYQEKIILDMMRSPRHGVCIEPGLGKTAITYEAFRRMCAQYRTARMLVIAPLTPLLFTWTGEANKWRQFNHFKIGILRGAHKEQILLDRSFDVLLINPEGLKWFYKQLMTQREVPAIDTLVIDESTKFKNIRARRTRYLLAVMEAFERRYILTGFPAPNGYLDLYAQIYVLDQGEALGINFTQFQRTYFWMERVGNYTRAKLRPQAANKINQRIAPLISQLTVEDVMVLPKLFHVPRYVHPPESFLRDYQKLEKELIVMIDNEPTAFQLSTATALIKCRQYVNGFVYADEKTHILNDYKITALKELVEQLGQKPVLIFYSFTADGKRIMAELDVPRKAQIHGGMKQSDKVPIFEKWNQGALDALVCHPSTMAHGANIQQGGHVMIWYSLLFDYELYYQGCRRLWRSGQEHQTYSYYLLMPGTVDMDIYHAIRGKKHRIYKDFIKFFKERINTSLRLN